MADGGKTPVTRGTGRAGNARTSTSATVLAGSGASVLSGEVFGEEQGRGATVRPRSKSPTKQTISPPVLSPTSRARTLRSPPGANPSRASVQSSSSLLPNSTSPALPSGTVSPSASLQALGPHGQHGHISNSVPATPYVHARRYSNEHRTPSPIPGTVIIDGNVSPRSVRSDSDSRVRPSQRNLVSMPCKFETGLATSRRRIPYSLGGDMLEKATEPVKNRLGHEEEGKLTKNMQQLYEHKLLPTAESEERRARFKAKLELIINERWPGHDIRVHVFGSSGNLLCTTESDVDICITAPNNVIGRMCNLAQCLSAKGMERIVCIPQAKVPIVKIWDPEFQLACDINVNNTAAIENTRMIRTYVLIDSRVRPLAMVVKHWTRRRVLNDAALGGTLSSYTWISLLIHFLQSREPAILPSLQQRPHQRTVNKEGQLSSFADNIDSLSNYGKANTETVGELLFGFFRYYAHEFDYESSAISIRMGKLLPKTEKRWHLSVNNRLCVEEPFNIDRNLGNTADDISFRGVHLELRRAFDLLCEARLDECCQQFEFPQEQERFWQRPTPQPLPILTRSRSQTNRSSRSSEGGGGRSNNKGRHSKGNGSGRRASSAAASNKNNMVFSPQINQGQWLMDGGPMSGQMIHEQLSQHMSMLQQQEAYFKLQQHNMAVAQTHAQSVAQLPQYQQSSPRHIQSMRDNPRRSSVIDPGPLSAPLRNLQNAYAFPFPATPRSGGVTPATAHVKHNVTNPSSPSLGMGRLAPTDLRRNAQRPMTPDALDMARSRSQPPVSSRDGSATAGDQAHPRLVYPAQFGGALSIYPGLQHYQQLHLHMKDRAARQTHQQTQANPQDHPEPARRTIYDPAKSDGHDGESRDPMTLEYVGRFSDPTNAVLGDPAAAQSGVSLSYGGLPSEQRPDRLYPLDPSRLRTSEKDARSRSSSPSLGDLSRDRSLSTQSAQSAQSAGQATRLSRDAGSLPTSLTSSVFSGGPIIIDGSGDSPSDTQPSFDSRPSSLYGSVSSDLTATEHDRNSELSNSESSSLHYSDAFHAGSMSAVDRRSIDTMLNGGAVHHSQMHFGEIPVNPSQMPYLPGQQQQQRVQRNTSNAEHGSQPRYSPNHTQSNGLDVSVSRTVQNGHRGDASWLEPAYENRMIHQRPNESISGLGIEVGGGAAAGNVDLSDTAEFCPGTPTGGEKNKISDQTNVPSAFHQQLPQGMANGSAVKSSVSNIIKATPLLSPVREVRTPSPTTSRVPGGLSPVQVKQKQIKESKKGGNHARALSLVSGQAVLAKDDSVQIDSNGKTSSRSGDDSDNGVWRGTGQNLNSESSAQPQTHASVSPMPLSYSAMARKPSQTHHDRQKPSQVRPGMQRTNSGSVSPRTRSPGGSMKADAESNRSKVLAEGSADTIARPPDSLVDLSISRSRTATGNSSSVASEESSKVTLQERQRRAKHVKELKDSVDRINLSGPVTSGRSGGSNTDSHGSNAQRPMSYAKTTTAQKVSGSSSQAQEVPTQPMRAPGSGNGNGANQANSPPSLSGWQQAVKRKGKRNSQVGGGTSAMHRRQANSIGGTILPSEIGEKGG